MAILGTSQPSSTPPHLYPVGMPQGGSVKHSLHHCDSDLPQMPSGLLDCMIPCSLPMVFSQGLADNMVLQLLSHITKEWTCIPKIHSTLEKNICKRGRKDVLPGILHNILQTTVCPSIPCSNVQRAFKDKTLNFHYGCTVSPSASNKTSQVSTCSKLQHLSLEPFFTQQGREFKSILIQSRTACKLISSPSFFCLFEITHTVILFP